MNLRGAIRNLAREPGAEIYALVGTVDSIGADRVVTVSPVNGSAPVDARLQATTGADSGMVVIPKVGSFVVVVFLGPANAFVALCSDVEKIELGGSENGAIIKITDLDGQIQKLSDQITLIRDALSAAPTGLADGGALFKATIVASLSALPFVAPDLSDASIGNPLISH